MMTSIPPDHLGSDSRSWRVSAPGKVILFGEHAVVYGKPAIATSINLRTTVMAHQFNSNDQNKFIGIWLKDLDPKGPMMYYPKEIIASLPTKDQANLEEAVTLAQKCTSPLLSHASQKAHVSVLLLARNILENMSATNFNYTFSVTSEIPVGAGLGSSASFGVAMATSLLIAQGSLSLNECDSPNRKLINEWAYFSETVIHANPSGVDNTVCTFGGAVLYKKGDSHRNNSLEVPLLKLILIDSGIPKDTKLQVAKVKVRYEKYEDVIQPLLDAIEGVVYSAHRLLCDISSSENQIYSSPDTMDSLCELIDMNHHLLGVCGVSHRRIEEIRQLSSQYGFVTKLTGAGGGGCVISLITKDSQVEAFESALSDRGFQFYNTSLGGPGVAYCSL